MSVLPLIFSGCCLDFMIPPLGSHQFYPPILMKQPSRPNCGLNCSKRDLFLCESFLNCQSASGLQYKLRGYIPTHTNIHANAHMICTHLTVVYCMWMFRRVQVVATCGNLIFKFAKYSQTFWKNYCVLFEPCGCWARYGRTLMLASNFFCACSFLPIAVSLSHHPIIQLYST